jgi:subtilase family serine protease
VVTGVSVSPPNAAPGQAVTFSATVQNQGATATPANTIVGVRFDVDGAVTTWSDTNKNSLAPGASVTLTANNGPAGKSTWSATSGGHSLQAWVDDVNRISEGDENNNKVSVSLSIGIDLVVTSITPSPLHPIAGQPTTFSAVIKNQGTVATPAGTVVGVRFDIDGAITSWSDTNNNSLAPGATVTLTANNGPTGSATWPATKGSHSLQAWVDDVNRLNDVNRGNNKFLTAISLP